MTKNVIAQDLSKGDIIKDTEGHGKTNPHGPDLTDEMFVDIWRGDAHLLKPMVENGKVSRGNGVALGYDEITSRIQSGRYELVDCKCQRTVDLSGLGASEDDDVYIRFGDIPDGGKSTNHTDGSKEDGVSAYEAKIKGTHTDEDADVKFVPQGNKIQQIIALQQRDTYLLTGDEVGRGEDGEPVLANIETVAELERANGGFVAKDD